MRILAPAAAALLLSACASTPAPAPVATARPTPAEPVQSGVLIGLTSAELGARFGAPRLTVREGDGTKLQYAGPACILDAYLYPPTSGSGAARVTHVDTRTGDGRGTDLAGCIAAIQAR